MEIMFTIRHQNGELSFRGFPFHHSFAIGGKGSDVVIPGCRDFCHISIDSREMICRITASDGAVLEGPDSNSCTLKPGQEITLSVLDSSGEKQFTVHADALTEQPVPQYDRFIDFPQETPVVLGRGSEADIPLRHPLVPDRAFQLIRNGNALLLAPLQGVPLGIYVNTKKVEKEERVLDGDFIFCAGFRAFWRNGQLCIPYVDEIIPKGLYYIDAKEQNSHLNYPLINRTTRLIRQRDTSPIEIQDPPNSNAPTKNNLLMSLLPVGLMIVLTVFLRMSSGSDNSYVLFSVATLAVGAVTSVITYLQTGKEGKKKEADRVASYRNYIKEQEDAIRRAREEERSILQSIYISPEQELENVQDFSAELFDRHKADSDFLDVCLGTGTARSGREITCKKHEIFEASDTLFQLPEKLKSKFAFVDDMPAWLPLRNSNAVGVIGDLDKLKEIFKIMMLDLTTRQYYDDVSIYHFLSEDFHSESECFRMMPHMRNRGIGRRNIVHDDESNSVLTEDLYKELSDRESLREMPESFPWMVIMVHADRSSLMQHPVIRYVEKASSLHAVFIFLAGHREFLPQNCSYEVQLFTNEYSGAITAMKEDTPDLLFSYNIIDDVDLRKASERLAPVRTGEINLAARLSSNESLFEMLGIHRIDDLDILDIWKKADTSRTLAAPLGVMETGDILTLDLHERAHGPHGLVAGTTGSGKSQVLISYLLSLACHFSPEDVTFCVIDFKGGDIVKHLPDLPHIVGSITNLEKREITRSLKAINAEKNKRMQLFADPAVNASNISEYTQAYKEGRAKIPLPHLLIIVDEFAELKSQHPDFMNDLISIARVGRSLGIHMILCTQKPAGVVDGQIWSNSDFKLCLRVQNKEDSNEVLKSPLAAEIREPGRGYLQVSRTSQFDLFQSGYSGGSEVLASQKDTAFHIDQINLSGKKECIYSYRPEINTEGRTQCEALLAAIIDAYKASGIAEPEKLCQPPIPDELDYQELPIRKEFSIPVGIYDDPDAQTTHPLEIEISGRNILIVGSSQMGKTTLLMTLLHRMAATMTPADVNVYIMDFNALVLKTMSRLSIVGGVVTAEEEEKMKNLFKLLTEEITARKAKFMEAGVTTFTAYNEINPEFPAVLVMLDNYAVFRELYDDKYGDTLSYILREGPAMGIVSCVTCQQASVLTYRKLFFFNQRLVLPLSEQSEYSSVLEGCRIAPKEVPGRVLIMRDKQFFEGQVFNAFTGETEAQRADNIRAFVDTHTGKPYAHRIPNVPEMLTLSWLDELCGDQYQPWEYAYGMDYNTVLPIIQNLNESFFIALLGSDTRGKDRYIDFFLKHAAAMAEKEQAIVYVVDGFERKWKHYQGLRNVTYTMDPEQIDEMLSASEEILHERLRKARRSEDASIEGETIIFVLNNNDAVLRISENSELLDKFNTIADRYRRMHIFFLFSSLDNKAVSYSSPELVKFIRDERKALIFDELNLLKFFDISLSQARQHTRPRANNEAFLLMDEDISRIKLIDAD